MQTQTSLGHYSFFPKQTLNKIIDDKPSSCQNIKRVSVVHIVFRILIKKTNALKMDISVKL